MQGVKKVVGQRALRPTKKDKDNEKMEVRARDQPSRKSEKVERGNGKIEVDGEREKEKMWEKSL